MQPVKHTSDKVYLLIKESKHSSKVRHPKTGEITHLPNEELEKLGQSPLKIATDPIPDNVIFLITNVHSHEGMGLLIELYTRGPVPTKRLLDDYQMCESNLNALLNDLKVGNLIQETEIHNEPGYKLTSKTEHALAHLLDFDS
ncbi:MAG: hypothetical protein ABEI86_03400 [Halobacteriaceae archaeon]